MHTNTTLTWLLRKATPLLALLVVFAIFFSPSQGLVAHAQAIDVTAATPATAPPPTVVASPVPPVVETPTQPTGRDLSCSWSTDTWSTCFTNIIYAFTVGLMSIFAYVGSFIFNIALKLSLSSTTYAQSFITTGWATVRDIANMAFIFILVYIAMVVIFKAETANTKRSLAAVIIVALVINFSFFATRVFVDAGNIIAVQFYNSIDAKPLEVTAGETLGGSVARYFTASASPTGYTEGTKDLTYNIMQLIGVQTLLGPSSFQSVVAFQRQSGFLANIIVFSFIYIAVGLVLAILAFIFIVVGIKFLVRIVMLWVLIIASPLALVAWALGEASVGGAAKGIFKKWGSGLVEYAFYPAVFLFMFWIVNLFAVNLGGASGSILNAAFSDIAIDPANAGSFLVPIAAGIGSVCIRLGLLVLLMIVALRVSDSVAAGGSVYARTAAGWAGGRLSGAVAWGGRNTLGRAGYRLSQAGTSKDWSSGNVLARTAFRGANQAAAASYDVRGVKAVNKALGAGGVSLGLASQKNFEKSHNERVAKQVAFANKLQPNERQMLDAYRKATANISASDQQQLEAHYENYLRDEEGFNAGRVSAEQLKKSRAGFESELARVSVGVTKEANSIAGVNNKFVYADNLETRRVGNLGGLLSSGIPGVIGLADKDAAAKIRGTELNRASSVLREALKASVVVSQPSAVVLPLPVQRPAPAPRQAAPNQPAATATNTTQPHIQPQLVGLTNITNPTRLASPSAPAPAAAAIAMPRFITPPPQPRPIPVPPSPVATPPRAATVVAAPVAAPVAAANQNQIHIDTSRLEDRIAENTAATRGVQDSVVRGGIDTIRAVGEGATTVERSISAGAAKVTGGMARHTTELVASNKEGVKDIREAMKVLGRRVGDVVHDQQAHNTEALATTAEKISGALAAQAKPPAEPEKVPFKLASD